MSTTSTLVHVAILSYPNKIHNPQMTLTSILVTRSIFFFLADREIYARQIWTCCLLSPWLKTVLCLLIVLKLKNPRPHPDLMYSSCPAHFFQALTTHCPFLREPQPHYLLLSVLHPFHTLSATGPLPMPLLSLEQGGQITPNRPNPAHSWFL